MLPLRPKQVEDLAFLLSHPRTAILHDPGVGKTPPVCVLIWNLIHNEKQGVAWSMPKSLFQKNKAELLKFTPLTEENIIIVDGLPAKRASQLRQENKVTLMSFTRLGEDYDNLPSSHKTLIVDEFHMGFANPESQRGSAFLRSIRSQFERVVIMTGSVIDGKLSTAYPVINAIAPQYYAGYRNFLAQHAVWDCMGEDIIGWKNHDKISRIFKKHCIRRTFEEEYGKANKVIMPMTRCFMSTKHAKAYSDMENMAMLELEDGSILDGEQEGVNLIRCRQIVACPHQFGILRDNVLTGKEEQLEVALKEHKTRGDKVILFCVFDEEVKRTYEVCKKWGLKAAFINGRVKASDRSKRASQFERGELDIIIGTPGTAAVGFNWACASDVIFLSTDYKDTNFSQAYKRGIRGKRAQPLRISVYSYGTKVEMHLNQVLNRKSRDAHKVDPSYEVISLHF